MLFFPPYKQLVRYYGFYSNKARGLRKKLETDDSIPALVDSDVSKKAFRKKWAQLIRKVYNVDPLICPKCSGKMRIIGFIEDQATIKKILVHLNLWLPQNNSPPKPVKNIIEDFQTTVDDEYLNSKYECDFSQETYYNEF